MVPDYGVCICIQDAGGKARVEEWLDKGRGTVVAGDVGLANSQLMEELLLADPRVMLVVQVRDPAEYAQSWMAISGQKQPWWETLLLQSRGITAAGYPTKEARLKKYMRTIIAEAYTLQQKFGAIRVPILDVKDLATEGPKLLRTLGAANTTWDMSLGRNDRSARFHRRKSAAAASSVVAEASATVAERAESRAAAKRPASRAVAKRPASRAAAKRPASRAVHKRPASRAAAKRPASRAVAKKRRSGRACRARADARRPNRGRSNRIACYPALASFSIGLRWLSSRPSVAGFALPGGCVAPWLRGFVFSRSALPRGCGSAQALPVCVGPRAYVGL